MRIYERTDYGLADIISQIKADFGFVYIPVEEKSGYIVLGEKVKLNLEFTEDDTLESAVISFPSDELDITESSVKANVYSSSIESSLQVVGLIDRMTLNNRDDLEELPEDEEEDIDIENEEPRVQ